MSTTYDDADDLTDILLVAEERFRQRFRMAASVPFPGKHGWGDAFCWGKVGGKWCFHTMLDNIRTPIEKTPIAVRLAAAEMIRPLWKACSNATDDFHHATAAAIASVGAFLDEHPEKAP